MSTTIDRQILIVADQILDSPEKWCKGALHLTGPDGVTKFCIRGAIGEAQRRLGLSRDSGWHTGADNLVAKAFGKGRGCYHINWQNNTSTTFAQMKDLR